MIPARPLHDVVPTPRPHISSPGPVPVASSAPVRPPLLQPDICKYCFECHGYYQGQMDGEYRCPECRAAGRRHERELAPLDGLMTVLPESYSVIPHRSPEQVYAEIGMLRQANR